MIANYDRTKKSYVIQYQVASQKIIAYLDGNAKDSEIKEFELYHKSICRDLIINCLNKDDKLYDYR